MEPEEFCRRMISMQQSLRTLMEAVGEQAAVADAADEKALALSILMLREAIGEYATQLNRFSARWSKQMKR